MNFYKIYNSKSGFDCSTLWITLKILTLWTLNVPSEGLMSNHSTLKTVKFFHSMEYLNIKKGEHIKDYHKSSLNRLGLNCVSFMNNYVLTETESMQIEKIGQHIKELN